MSRAHHKLEVWRRAIGLVKNVYSLSATFPAQELYGLTSQMRRSAVSVPGNIAEAVGRAGGNDRLKYLVIARGSLIELDTYVVLARELGYTSDSAQLENEIDGVIALLSGLMNAERRKNRDAN
jgi:four helix bundle protein